MSCQSARDDYVQAVADLCEMTRHLLGLQESYTADLLAGADLRCEDIRRRWQLYLTGITRLLSEEDAAYRAYDHARGHH